MNTLAIIPARGGSKRIPQKNITPVAGFPLLAWSIRAAIESNVCDRIIVSTDAPEVAEVAKQYGVEVPFLRMTASDDEATASDACLAALEQAQVHWNESYDNVILLMPTCPLRTGAQISSQYERFLNDRIPFLLSCAGFGPTKPWWAFTMDEEGRSGFLHPESLKIRSQLLEKLYAPSGATWIAKTEELRCSGSFYGTNHRFYEIPWVSALDIDEPDDIALINSLICNSQISPPASPGLL